MDPTVLTGILQLKVDKQTSAQWRWESRSHVLELLEIDNLLVFLKDCANTLESQGPG